MLLQHNLYSGAKHIPLSIQKAPSLSLFLLAPLSSRPVKYNILFAFQPGTSQNCGEGYNSEDEYSHLGVNLTEEEWVEKDRKFERAMKKKGKIYVNTVGIQILDALIF